jgi:hypothetical protein
MWKDVLGTADADAIMAIVMIFRRIGNSKEFIQKLSASGFLKEFIKVTFTSPSLVRAGCLLIDTLGRQQYLADFIDVIPLLAEAVQLDLQLHAALMGLISALKVYPQLSFLFSQYHIPELVAELTLPQSHEKYRQDLLSAFATE